MPVGVDLPLSVGIPVEYVPDNELRLRLYRRIADLQREDELEALGLEFVDRFGAMPDQTRNLFYQIKIKILAQKANLASVNIENDQIVLRYPPLPDGSGGRSLPFIGLNVRAGRNAYWMGVDLSNSDWTRELADALTELVHLT